QNNSARSRRLLYSTPQRPSNFPLFPYTTLFRSRNSHKDAGLNGRPKRRPELTKVALSTPEPYRHETGALRPHGVTHRRPALRKADRKSTRLNSSHVKISYAVFCLKKKNRIPVQN